MLLGLGVLVRLRSIISACSDTWLANLGFMVGEIQSPVTRPLM